MDWFDRESRLRRIYKECFSTEEGQEVLTKLIQDHFVFKTTPTPDPYLSAWQEGQRSVVLKILEMVDTDLRVLRTRYDQQELAKRNRQDNLNTN
jgi:hypothetical protein